MLLTKVNKFETMLIEMNHEKYMKRMYDGKSSKKFDFGKGALADNEEV